MNSPDARNTFRFAALSVVKHAYVPNGVAAHPRFEPVVVADDDAMPAWVHQRNQEYADQHSIPYVRDVEQALRDFDVQVAVVSSEAERHCDLSLRAVDAGLHVVSDKPMSTCVADCDRVVAAVNRSGVKFLLWNRNFLPAIVHARQIIDAGEIGPIHAIHVDFYFAKDSGPPIGSRRPGDPPIDWLERQIEAHADGSDGGVGQVPMGELAVEGIYPLAYIRTLCGVEIERVFARTKAHFHQAHADNEVEDLASVTLEMQQGVLGSLCIGRIGAASHPDIGEIKIHVLGDQGGLVVNEARPEVAVYYRGQPPHEFRHRRIAIDNDFLLMENFAEAIDNDGDTALDAEAGRTICAVVEAAIESGRSGRPEPVG